MNYCIRVFKLLLTLCLLLSTTVVFSNGFQLKEYSLSDKGQLLLNVPDTWKDSIKRPADNLPPTINFNAQSGKQFEFLITPIWSLNNRPPMTTEELHKNVKDVAVEFQPLSVEKEIKINEIKGRQGTGYYFKSTDRAPKPDEFKYLTQGMIKVRDLIVTFSILTNDGQDAVRESALDVIKNMANVRAVSSIEKQGSVYRIAVPETGLLLEFPLEEFELVQQDDFRPYYYLTNSKTGLNASFNFDRTTKCNSGESCRDYFVDKVKTGYSSSKINWRTSQLGGVFVAENMDGPVSGINLKQQHMNAHFVKEGVWIDVHLSKVHYQESDRKLFVNFVRSIQFSERGDSESGDSIPVTTNKKGDGGRVVF